jgi:RNAse (barnase) inhibitor barstar
MQIINQHQLPTFSSDTFVVEIDGNKARSLRAFYTRIAKLLLFPDYFGKNLDALFDCLISLEVIGKEDIVLLIRNEQQFLSKEKVEKRNATFQVLKDAEIQENRYDSLRFRVIAVK